MRPATAFSCLLLACGDDGAGSAEASSSGDASLSATTTFTTTSMSSAADSSGSESGSTGDPIDPPPACGSLDYDWRGLLAGPSEPGFDAELEQTAIRLDRIHVALVSLPVGLAGDLSIAAGDAAAQASIESFVAGDAWDFEAATGMKPGQVLASWRKSTGAFTGVAAAADAYRYGTLRDQGHACEDVERARAQLVRALDGLHLATELTGVPGLVVRAIAHRDYPGDSESATTPLSDGAGDPLPAEKTNGTWREDASGSHPELVWEDACSRDQLIGWVAGYGAMWEVIEHDPEIDQALKDRLQADAAAIARQLMTVRPSGYDLEIWDPDGRPTPHGYLHENNLEGDYLAINNGQHAIMAAGIVAALAYVADDPEIDAYLHDGLIADRDLVGVAAQSLLVDFGYATNWSNYNMAFTGAWLVARYLDHDGVQEDLDAAAQRLYENPGSDYPVSESGQALFDVVDAVVLARAGAATATENEPDAVVIDRALAVLRAYPAPPAWDLARENCDVDEIAAGTCTLDDGSIVEVLGPVGHNDELVVAEPVGMAVRPPSNFYWRTNPYQANGGGDGSGLHSGADFRFAYWLARFVRRP